MKRALLAFLLAPLIAYGQSYPSPTFNNLNLNGQQTLGLSLANRLQMTGGSTGNPVNFFALGADSNISMYLWPQGAFGTVNLLGYGGYLGGGGSYFGGGTISNYLYWSAGVTGVAPGIQALGADTNIGFGIAGKGTGVVAIGVSGASTALPAAIAEQSEVLLTSGTSYTYGQGVGRVILDGVAAAFSLTMMPAPIDGQWALLECGSTVTSLTVLANTGQTIKGTTATCSPDQGHAWHYRSSNATWYKDC